MKGPSVFETEVLQVCVLCRFDGEWGEVVTSHPSRGMGLVSFLLTLWEIVDSFLVLIGNYCSDLHDQGQYSKGKGHLVLTTDELFRITSGC